MSKNLIYIGLAFFAWLGYKKFILSEKIKIGLKNIGFNGGTFFQPIVNVQLEVENPTKTTADVQKVAAEILLQNKVVGTIYQDINKTIQAQQKTVIGFDVSLNLADAAILLISNKFKNQIIELKGNLVVDFIYFPLNFEIKLP
jgi:K+-transporting ATPase A subunit